jgi:hypothetical protein
MFIRSPKLAARTRVLGMNQTIAILILALSTLWNAAPVFAQHDRPAPEKLGKVKFPVSCMPKVQNSFNHAVALLHSFAYAPARQEFAAIAERDPLCAMAHWGAAISYYHQLWDPPISPDGLQSGALEIQKALSLASGASEREQAFIQALAVFFASASRSPIRIAALAYTNAMRDVATQNEEDTESQIFYALAFLAIASPSDPAHTNQKLAAAMLEPLFQRFPDHPGLAHYLIHAYDHPDLARQGITAARAYSKIAPSAPHALHMPSHIFTLLGLWPDSIRSNLAARAAAHQQSDIGEELHSMDYLMYAYLQAGRFDDAAALLADLRAMSNLPVAEYKVAYASTIMPVRVAVERRQWEDALNIAADRGAPPQFRAIAEWANSIAASHLGKPPEAELHLHNLQDLLTEVRNAGDDYWTSQLQVQSLQAEGWLWHARGDDHQATSILSAGASQEDGVAKRPMTPGPVTPAREQLADLLLDANHPAEALHEYELVLKSSPGRRNALSGAARAATLSGDSAKAQQFAQQLKALH